MAKGNKTLAQPHWHPDFRIAETLPDIKVVRTAFLVNFLVVALALGLVGYFVFTELERSALETELAETAERIAGLQPADRKAISLNKTFKTKQTLPEDLLRFYQTAYEVVPMVEAISQAIPDNVLLTTLSVDNKNLIEEKGRRQFFRGRQGVIQLQGVLQGSSSQDVSQIIELRNQLEALPVLEGKIENISNSTPRPGDSPYSYTFTITILLKTLT
jgi:Tfp pilus assembly protein PilN